MSLASRDLYGRLVADACSNAFEELEESSPV